MLAPSQTTALAFCTATVQEEGGRVSASSDRTIGEEVVPVGHMRVLLRGGWVGQCGEGLWSLVSV